MKPSKRRNARVFALQALYQYLLSGTEIAEIEKQFLEEKNLAKFDVNYFQKLLQGVANEENELDEIFTKFLDRKLSELTPIELTLLRMATFELLHCLDVPYKVVINEAIELGKKFGATDAHKYLNGVLDKVANELRQNEK